MQALALEIAVECPEGGDVSRVALTPNLDMIEVSLLGYRHHRPASQSLRSMPVVSVSSARSSDAVTRSGFGAEVNQNRDGS